jgi:hypothetical protein
VVKRYATTEVRQRPTVGDNVPTRSNPRGLEQRNCCDWECCCIPCGFQPLYPETERYTVQVYTERIIPGPPVFGWKIIPAGAQTAMESYTAAAITKVLCHRCDADEPLNEPWTLVWIGQRQGSLL